MKLFTHLMILILALTCQAMAAEKMTVKIATAKLLEQFWPKECPNGAELCGPEYEMFQEICRLQNLDCQWSIKDWAVEGKGPMEAGGIFHNLLDKNCDNPETRNENCYDVVINIARNSKERRTKMLFTMPYFRGQNKEVIGDKALESILLGNYNSDNLPKDKSYFENGRKLKIATVAGAMLKDLNNFYPEPKHIEIVSFETHDKLIEALVKNEIDLYFSLQGSFQAVETVAPERFTIVSHASAATDPRLGAAAAVRPSVQGLTLVEKLNDGLLQVRRSQNGQKSLHQKLFEPLFGFDPWPCQSTAYHLDDLKCGK